jgi:hypothetical protein
MRNGRRRAFSAWVKLGMLLAVLLLVPATTWGQTAATERKLLYVALDNRIKIFDIADGHRFVRSIELPGHARSPGLQASIVRQLLYISYLDSPQGGARLLAIDLRTDQLVWSKPYPGADAISVTADGKKLFLSAGEGSTRDYFYVIDAITGNQLDTISVHPHTHNGMVGPSQRYVYLSSVDYPYLVMADVETHAVVRQIGPFGAGIRPITVNGRESLVFVNVNGLQGFEVGDVATGQVLHRVAVEGFPYTLPPGTLNPSHGVALTRDERELWIAGATNYVHIFDATVMPPRQVASIQLSRQPKWVNFSLDGRYAYPGSGDVVDVATRRVVARYDYSKRQIEVDFLGSDAIRASDYYGIGGVMGPAPAASTPTITPTPDPNARAALLVTGAVPPSADDALTRTRLESLGFVVTVRGQSVASAADASGKDLVVISSSVSSGSVSSSFRTLAVPLLTWEYGLFDDLGLTSFASGSFGETSSQTQIAMLAANSGHPLAAGRSGTVTVSSATSFSWGKPGAGALTIATLSGDSSRAAIFGYESGASLVDGAPAPARRVGFFFGNTAPSRATGDAWALFDAAARWASAAPSGTSPSPTPTATATTAGSPTPTATATATSTSSGSAASPTAMATATTAGSSTPTATRTATATPSATAVGGTSYSFGAAADTFVDQAQASSGFGNWNQLNAVGNTGKAKTVYIRFTVSGLPSGAAISGAKLRLRVINDSTDGGDLYRVSSTSWAESMSWNGRPALDTLLLGQNAVSVGQLVELDVTSQVLGNGSYSFALVMPSGNGNTVGYASREHATTSYRPQLVVTTR